MNTRLNVIYNHLKTRCFDPSCKDFENYGARGITVCDEWNTPHSHKGWLAFKKWALENGYNDSLTIDRIDVNKNYCPSNCRWVSRSVQNNNTRRTILVTHNGKTQSLKQWCIEKELKYTTIYTRIFRNGWTVNKALEFAEKEGE